MVQMLVMAMIFTLYKVGITFTVRFLIAVRVTVKVRILLTLSRT